MLVVAVITAAGCANSSAETSPSSDLSASIERGRELTVELGCAACHSPDGTSRIGPSWAGSWGSDVELDDGTTVEFDAAYVTRSVRDPTAQRRAGSWIQMPPFGPARVSDDDLTAIAAYLQDLGDG